jgi:ATP-binding cassette subfamily B protein
LAGVNVKISKGEHISIVGANGAGKSTFLKLLIGLYKPISGTIRLNGEEISSYFSETLNRIFLILFQDYKIYPFSILENVVFDDADNGLPEYDKKRIYEIYRQVGLYDKINSLENKDSAVMSKLYGEGVELSGGQWLKLALSRILYQNAPVIILDEPSAALDPLAEFEFYDLFSDIAKSHIAIYVSHRLISCSLSDRILVFDKGKIVEDGSHKDLYDGRGLYRGMYDAQASLYT